MNKNSIPYYETEALKLKSLLTLIAGTDPDNTEAFPEVVEVAKIAKEIAESLYCAIADQHGKE